MKKALNALEAIGLVLELPLFAEEMEKGKTVDTDLNYLTQNSFLLTQRFWLHTKILISACQYEIVCPVIYIELK